MAIEERLDVNTISMGVAVHQAEMIHRRHNYPTRPPTGFLQKSL